MHLSTILSPSGVEREREIFGVTLLCANDVMSVCIGLVCPVSLLVQTQTRVNDVGLIYMHVLHYKSSDLLSNAQYHSQ